MTTAEAIADTETAAGISVAEPFDAFYRASVEQVCRALTITLGNPALAREATDEAMARAFARWPRVARYSSPAGWVYRVGLNWATSWWRKIGRERPPINDGLHQTNNPIDPAAFAARAALADLSRPHRAVVVCRVLLDLSTAETAVALNIAEGTVKSRLARALTALRSALDEENPA